jgi:hypothetical protein
MPWNARCNEPYVGCSDEREGASPSVPITRENRIKVNKNSILYKSCKGYLFGYALACAVFVSGLIGESGDSPAGAIGQVLVAASAAIVGGVWIVDKWKQYSQPKPQHSRNAAG